MRWTAVNVIHTRTGNNIILRANRRIVFNHLLELLSQHRFAEKHVNALLRFAAAFVRKN